MVQIGVLRYNAWSRSAQQAQHDPTRTLVLAGPHAGRSRLVTLEVASFWSLFRGPEKVTISCVFICFCVRTIIPCTLQEVV